VNASDLVERVVEQTGLSKRVVRSVLHVALDDIVVALATEERVSLSGFGTFDVRRRSSRPGRHPTTGAALTLPEKRAVLFHAGRRLQQALAAGSAGQESDADTTHASPIQT